MAPNTTSTLHNKIKSKAEENVDLLLREGFLIPCDDSTVDSTKINELPIWFNEEKFKRGQKFFHDNILVMFFGKFCGLFSILLCSSMLKILQLTNMSSTPQTAYKRYMATIFHMTIWYDENFKPGSDLWKSLKIVRNLHFAASRRAVSNNLRCITQADMVITQFGFMGFILSKPKTCGIYNATHEEFEGFVHLWRVVGYLLGIEDKFNLCSGTVEETRAYCDEIIKRVIKPELEKVNENFYTMSNALLDGMSVFQPFLNYGVTMTYIHKMCNVSLQENSNANRFVKMNIKSKFILYFTMFNLYTYHWFLFKLYHNILQHFALYYIIKYFPFLAYIKFGIKNSHLPPAVIKTNPGHIE